MKFPVRFAASASLAVVLAACAGGTPTSSGDRVADATLLDRYVGAYRLQAKLFDIITRKGNHLYTRVTGERAVELLAENDHDFYVKANDAHLTFVTDPQGQVVALLLRQNGHEWRAPRVSAADAAAAEATMDPEFPMRSTPPPMGQGMMR